MDYNDLYHSDLSRVSASMLKALDESPRVFQAKYIAGAVDEPTAAMQFGTALHCYVLERERFDAQYVVKPDGMSFATKDGKAWRAEQIGKFIVSHDDYQKIRYMEQMVYQDQFANALVQSSGKIESVIHWTDELSGVACKMKSDKLINQVIVDIKTMANCTETAFAYACRDFRYDIQAAHYIDGVRATTGKDAKFYFICVETSSPYRCRVFDIDESSLDAARQRRAVLLDDYKRRMEVMDWSEDGEGKSTTIKVPQPYSYRG